jgi:tetratricopeptide (TPR) repeat protein
MLKKMKINCAIIIDSIEEKQKSILKFPQIENINFFTFDKNLKSINLLNSRRNINTELSMFFDQKSFFVLYPDEDIELWDDEESFGSHYNLIIDDWIIKSRRTNTKEEKVSKIFIRSNYKNVIKYDDLWNNLWQDGGNFINRLEEYLFIVGINEENLFLVYRYIFEKLKKKMYDDTLKNLFPSVLNNYPNFVELLCLWGDFLYESNRIEEARLFYVKALKSASERSIYDKMPMIPRMHKSHPEKMLANIESLIKKYDQVH